MSGSQGPAPIYVDAFTLCEWLLGHFGDKPGALSSALCGSALDLLAALTLALKGRRRDEHLELADERLLVLRTQLRLAAAAGHLTDAQLVHGLDRADAIGRQLGGWLRALGPV